MPEQPPLPSQVSTLVQALLSSQVVPLALKPSEGHAAVVPEQDSATSQSELTARQM